MKEFLLSEKTNRSLWAVTAVLFIAALDVADYVTGPAFAFSLFYLIPVSMASWFVGGWFGIALSVVSSSSWLITVTFAGRINFDSAAYYWEAFTRLIFFSIVAVLFSALRKSLQHESILARTDKTTGASNKRHFYELLQAEMTRSERYKHAFTVAYFDLDNFKEVNDRFGHNAGDEVLTSIVTTVRMYLRATDLIARLGGDEFAILMPETGQEQAKANIGRIHEQLLKEMRNKGWPVTFSIGVLTYSDVPPSVDETIRLADNLMYSVKNSGKNAVSYSLYSR